MWKCGVQFEDEMIDKMLESDDKEDQQKSGVSDLLKSPVLVRISLQMAFIWIVTTLTYYKLAIGENSGNMLVDNVFSALIEIAFLVPGAWMLQQRWCKRRWFLGD